MLRLCVIFAVFVVGQALTPSSFLSTVDKSRFKSLFQSSLTEESTISYAILGLKLLGETAPNAGDLCNKLQAGIDKPDASAATIFASSAAAKALGSCALKPNAQAGQALASAAGSDSSVADLYHGVLAQHNLGQKVANAAVFKQLQTALKKDDSVANLGLAFNLAAALGGPEATAVFERVEDAIVQADEINGKVLQFEGGLSVSSNIVSGAYTLSKVAGKTPPISKMQAVKFANYFLGRKSVNQVKSAWHVLSALQTLATNDFHTPVAITIASTPSVSLTSPLVKVQVTDVFGNPLGKMNVQIDSAMRQSDGAVVMSKSQMKESADSLYEVDLMAAKPGRGFYELTVTATPLKANAKLAGNEAATLIIKVLGSVSVDSVEIGVGDADQSTAAKTTKVAANDKLKAPLNADHHHKLVMKFAVTDQGEKVRVHQAFVRFALGNAEIIYVAEPDNAGNYKFDLDVSAKAKEFGSKSGKYSIHLLIGDAVINNPMDWYIGDINLEFPASDEQSGSKADLTNKPLPEIRHLFREPEVRPPGIVSSTFTILCLAPFGVMLIAWMRLGVNISAFPFSLSALGFHLGLACIFGLYYCFWLELNMFTTFKYLIMIGVVTFLCGNSMLVKIAEKRKNTN